MYPHSSRDLHFTIHKCSVHGARARARDWGEWMLLNVPTRNELGLKCFSHYKSEAFNLRTICPHSPRARPKHSHVFQVFVLFVCWSLLCNFAFAYLSNKILVLLLLLLYTHVYRSQYDCRCCCFWRCRHKLYRSTPQPTAHSVHDLPSAVAVRNLDFLVFLPFSLFPDARTLPILHASIRFPSNKRSHL